MRDQPDITELRRDVHHGLGRALLRFQHLEQTLKSLVVARFISVAPSAMCSGWQKRQEEVMTSPLGWLKEELLAKMVRPEGVEMNEAEMDNATKKGHAAFRFHISIPVEVHACIERHLAVVHERRNQVVHHFLDAFDMQTIESCEAAKEFLLESHVILDTHQEKVIDFAKWTAKTMAAIVQDPEFQNALTSQVVASTVRVRKKARKRLTKKVSPLKLANSEKTQ